MQQLQHIRSTTVTAGPLGPQPAKYHGLQFGYDPKGPEFQNTKALADHFRKELGLAA
jgi:hypothetical protein